jgi:argininosuccinate synthase
MKVEFGSYGEMNKGWTATEAKGFIKLTGNATKIYHHLNPSE